MQRHWSTRVILTLLPIVFGMLSLSVAIAADSRGMKIVIKDRGGKAIGGYSASHALLIGVSDYTAGWPDLESVPGEMDSVAGMLARQGFEVQKVLNPTAAQMKRAFEGFIDRYGFNSNDRLLFVFSGHGYNRLNGKKGYLVPSDAPDPRRDETGFLRKALDMSQILSWCRRMEAKHVLFLFDSCFSGTIFKTRALGDAPPHISHLTSKPVRQFITAGSAGEKVPARSVFAPSLTRGLRGDADVNGDGYVTGTELGMYLHDKVLGYESGQTPQYGKIRDPDLDEGDFVFVALGNAPVARGKNGRFISFSGYQWESLDGEWRVRDGILFGGPAASNHLLLQSPIRLENYTAECTVEYIRGPRNTAAATSWGINLIPGGGKRFRDRTVDIEGYGFNFTFHQHFNLFKGVKGGWYLVEPTWKYWQHSTLLADKVRIKIVARDTLYKLYANNVLVARFMDKQFPVGGFALYLGSGLEAKIYDFKLNTGQ